MGRSRGLVNLICEYNDALSDPQRVKMMKIMGSNPPNTVTVSKFAEILGISQPSATKHLKILHTADLISRKRIGTSVFYSMNLETIDEYHNLLDLAFVRGFSPCLYGFKCDECPEMDTCA
ncbi:MAG: winged helix-turn-helix transcriptional regulator [Clostridiaceae bacterium]|jgi:DNA-binding transcriptional ArsR family regulator|nr:winged helix-turn-helix transcriptional regulator [Clostridiaceae bacterium]